MLEIDDKVCKRGKNKKRKAPSIHGMSKREPSQIKGNDDVIIIIIIIEEIMDLVNKYYAVS